MKTKLVQKGREINLGEIATFQMGGTPDNNEINSSNAKIPWIKGSDLNKEYIYNADNFITQKGLKTSRARYYEVGTVLIGRTGQGKTRGRTAILRFGATTNETVIGIIPDFNFILPEFLHFNLMYRYQELRDIAGDDKRGGITQNDLKNLMIFLPSIQAQKKIISVLEKTEKLKQMRKDADELTKNYLKAVFLEMFGDPIKNSKKWEVKKMKDMSKKIGNGITPKGGKEVYVEKGIVFLRSQNVWKNKLLLDDVAHIDEDTHAKMIKSSLKNKDILMTKTGRINTENSSLGRATMFLGEDDSANINGHVYLIRLQENIIHEFVLFIITTNEYREYIRSVCVGGIDKRQLNKEHIQNFPIIFPPVELQNKFVSIVKEVESMKELQKQSGIQIHNLFNHLMQKAFKGELVC